MEMTGLATIYGNGNTTEILPKEITSHTLRRGKWTVEEERYTEKIIMDFENGTLDVPEGTTLRTYLSKVLNCDPMRITKKYTGNSSIGKRTFTPLVRSPENVPFIDMSQRELEELRRNWISKLLLAEQWNHRKLSLMKNGKPFFSSSKSVDDDGNSVHSHSSPSHHHANSRDDELDGDGDDEEHGYQSHKSSNGSTVKLREDTISNALKPFIADPSKISYILNWLKTSCVALNQPTTSLDEIEQLIAIGELSLPALEKVLKSAGITSASQLENLHKMLTAYSTTDQQYQQRTSDDSDEGGANEIEEEKTSSRKAKKVKSESIDEHQHQSQSDIDEANRRNRPMKAHSPSAYAQQHPSITANPYPFYYAQIPTPSGNTTVDPADKKNRRKRDRDAPISPIPNAVTGQASGTSAYPENFPVYFPPNYLYGYSAPFTADFMNPAAAMRMPSYQDYLHAMYLQQKGLIPTAAPVMSHPAEQLYDSLYLRQMNHWIASNRSRQNSEDMEAYQNMLQQAQQASNNATTTTATNATSKKATASAIVSAIDTAKGAANNNVGSSSTSPTLTSVNRSSGFDPAVVTPTMSLKTSSSTGSNNSSLNALQKTAGAGKNNEDSISESSGAKSSSSSGIPKDIFDAAAVGPPSKKQKSPEGNLIKVAETITSPLKSESTEKSVTGSGTKKTKSTKTNKNNNAMMLQNPTENVESGEGSIEFAAEALLGLQRR